MAEYANWKSGQLEKLVILSVRLRLRPLAVPWSNGTTPARHAGDDGSTPSGITDVMVCRCFGEHRRGKAEGLVQSPDEPLEISVAICARIDSGHFGSW